MAADPVVVATPRATHLTPPIGTRVWIVRLGVSGRIHALAQGGLTCRVQLEDGSASHDCRNGDLLLLSD